MEENIFKSKSRRCFDAQADHYDNTHNGRHSGRLYSDVVAAIGSGFDLLLDVGCGTGNVLALLPQEKHLCGIDLSSEMIRVAENRLPRAELVTGDAEKLPWPDASYDIVNCTDSFHHYPNPSAVLTEMHRVLKKDGRLVLADPRSPALLRVLFNAFSKYGDDGDVRLYSKTEITVLLNKAGFTDIHFRKLSHDAFIVTAKAL